MDYYDQIKIAKVNVDASKKIVKDLILIEIPYLAMYENGKLFYSKNVIVPDIN
ncbi:MAG: hypothetical protein KAH68_05810 [Draconibacterium sp.]|nr:hypothetical protein [Draconibacterium sp.]